MFVPFLSERTPAQPHKHIYPRKGGGGGKSGGGSKGGGGSTGGSKGGGSSSPKPKSVPLGGKAPAGKGTATAYGGGGGKVTTIPSGSIFAGRTAGGGSRNQVFGSRTYGSGYPGVSGRGVFNRGFPFYFWPVVWGGSAENAAYLHDSEYGDPSNSSRPGGPMTQANFISNSTNTTFHLLADNSTVSSLISTIDTNCSSHLSSSSSTTAIAYNSSDPNAPQPQQAVQYYRASSVVLTLDGYNDTAALSNDTNALDTPLPTNIDTTLLDCLNQTIGLSVPLIDAAGVRWTAAPGMGAIGLFWVAWLLVGNLI